MNAAIGIPRPWKVMPATRMGRAWFGGCEGLIKEARVP
jgi:hypothetical protein